MPRELDPDQGGEARVPVAIYSRVSTDNQVGGRFDSCESQTAVCRDHIRKHTQEGWYEVASFTDAAYSGGTMDRPGMRNLKRMIQAGEVKVVLIYKLERVSRNMDEWGPFRAFLQKHGCQLESATENISELEPEGRLKNNIMMSVAEFERLNTAKKTRLKMREQAKRGFWNGGPVPYGYQYDKNTQALQPHPVEGQILKRIFEQAAKLVSLTDVANALNAEGLRTKERVMQRRDGNTETIGGRFFRSDGLRLLIRNPIYRGTVKFEGQEFAGKHESLVSADDWEKANAAVAETQERPGQPSVEHPSFQARDAHNHLFKGIAWCASCRRALVPSDSGKKSVSGIKYRYYTCSLILRESQTARCPVGRLSADALEKAVISLLGEASEHPDLIREMVEVSRSTRRRDAVQLRAEVDKQKAALTDIDKQLANCASAVAKGGIDVLGEALVRKATELREQRRRLLVEQERGRQELVAANAMVLEEQTIRKNLERFGVVFQKLPPAEQKELVGLLVDRIEVRRAVETGRRKNAVSEAITPSERLMEIRVKLHNAELAQGLEERAQRKQSSARRAHQVGQLDLRGRVDFTNAMRGEVTITAPFSQTLRLDARVRTVPAKEPEIEHPIVRAQKWQHMLENGTVPNRLALAKRVGVDPGMVTRVLRLVRLAPPIQAYLSSVGTASGAWHFNIRALGEIAMRPLERQERDFASLVAQYERRLRADSPTMKQCQSSPSEFGDRIATCIGEAEVEAYIKNYPDRYGNVGKASPYTRETYLRHMRMVLRAAGVEKPFPNALARLPKEREIHFFSVDQVKKMLSSARSSERGMLALALFAGLRPTRLGEIPKSSINIPDRTIRIAGEFSKNHRSIFLETVSTENGHDFRPGPPPVLWSWLERYGFLPCNWGKIHRRMRAALGDFWIADGCRHTAATYYCCKFGVAATAELLGHTDTELVRRHYAGHATRAEADAFFAITPDSLPPAPEPDHPLAKVCISPAEMADHLRTRRISEIARLLGCSAGSIKSFCRRNGLKTPAAGYWNMKANNVASTIVESTTSAPVDTNSTAENSKNVGTGPTLAANPENAQRETNLTTTDGALLPDCIRAECRPSLAFAGQRRSQARGDDAEHGG